MKALNNIHVELTAAQKTWVTGKITVYKTKNNKDVIKIRDFKPFIPQILTALGSINLKIIEVLPEDF